MRINLKELVDTVRNFKNRIFLKVLMNRQRQNTFCLFFSHWEFSFTVSQSRSSRLQVNGYRIVNCSLDPMIQQICLKFVALIALNHEGMVSIKFFIMLFWDKGMISMNKVPV